VTEHEGYDSWRSLALAIKDAAKKAAQQAGPRVSAASVDAKIRQARFDRFLSRVFAHGEQSEWLLKGGMSMLARVPRSRTTKDMDLAAQHVTSLAEAERALTKLVDVDLGDHLTFRLVRSTPTGLGDNQPGVATRRHRNNQDRRTNALLTKLQKRAQTTTPATSPRLTRSTTSSTPGSEGSKDSSPTGHAHPPLSPPTGTPSRTISVPPSANSISAKPPPSASTSSSPTSSTTPAQRPPEPAVPSSLVR
jgi:hypothetical protein